MCGIFGFSHSTPETRRMSLPLAVMMESRGRDSWGVTDGDYIYKAPFAITEDFVEFELGTDGYGVVYHTRGASVGIVSERNAHPFEAFSLDKTKRVVGVHNGHLQNWQALKQRYQRTDLEVDSEHIFRHLAEGKPVEEIGGWGAVVWYEMEAGHFAERKLYLSKFGGMDNLHVMRLNVPTKPIVFCSTGADIRRAAVLAGVEIEKTYAIHQDIRYLIEPRDGVPELLIVEPMEWGKKSYDDYRNANSGAFGYAQSNLETHYCGVGSCNKKLLRPSKQLICDDCVKLMVANYIMSVKA